MDVGGSASLSVSSASHTHADRKNSGLWCHDALAFSHSSIWASQGSSVKLKPTGLWALLSFCPSCRHTLFPWCVSLTWGCRGHVRLSCGWPPADRSSGASSRRQRRIYHRLTWRCRHCCCCSPMAPSISSFCGQEEQCEAEGERINSAGDTERRWIHFGTLNCLKWCWTNQRNKKEKR